MDITENESSRERMFLGTNTLENEKARGPGSKLARVLLARERTGCESGIGLRSVQAHGTQR